MAKKYNMDGISDPYFSSDKQYKDYTNNVSGTKKQNSTKQTTVKETDKRTNNAASSHSSRNDSNDRSKGQYEKILGISDPAFSGGDEYVAYGDYLNRIAKKNEPPADDQSVVEMAVRTKTESNDSHRTTVPEWINSISLPIQYAKQASKSLYYVGIMPVNPDTSQRILAQRARQEQIANSMGGFRLAAQQADEKSAYWANANAAKEANRDVIQKYGLSAGTMPVSQYGSQATPPHYSTGIMPANKDTPQQVLEQRTAQEQIAKSMGKFRQAAQQADEKSAYWANAKAAEKANRGTIQRYGLGAGTMPVSQYGSQATPPPYSTGILPENRDTPQQVLAQQAKKEQIANGMGGFRLAAQQADKKSTFNGSMPDTKTLSDLGTVFDYLKTYGQVMGGTKGETIAIAAEILSSNINGMKIGSAIAQETTDKNNEIELSTIATAAGLMGDVIGTAVGSFVAGPVGAFAGGYLGDQLLTELAIAIYNSQPVSWEEALERTSKLTSTFMPQSAQSPQEILNDRQVRMRATTGRGDS